MLNRYRRLALMAIILLWAMVGVAEHALALTFTEFSLSTAGSLPNGITMGPDGALWFTETGANKIGRVTTAGVISEFPIPTAGSQPH
jgi:streptogramin lyase